MRQSGLTWFVTGSCWQCDKLYCRISTPRCPIPTPKQCECAAQHLPL